MSKKKCDTQLPADTKRRIQQTLNVEEKIYVFQETRLILLGYLGGGVLMGGVSYLIDMAYLQRLIIK